MEAAPATDLAMGDDELIEEFIRVESDGDRVWIMVREISWGGPQTPVSGWTFGGDVAPPTDPEVVAAAVRKVLENRWFFRVCSVCELGQPRGWMHDEKLCQSCAERELGIVY